MRHLSFILLFAVTGWALAGTLYRTVGADGQVTYSDQAPSNSREQRAIHYETPPASPLPASVLKYQEDLKKGLSQRLSEAAKPRADAAPLLLSAAWCGYCKQAKQYLAARGIQYTELDVETPAGLQAAAQLGATRGVPVLSYRGKQLSGFSAASYDSFLAAIK